MPAPARWYSPIRWYSRAQIALNRLTAQPKFQRWAIAFPLTRPVARRQSGELFDLCAGFVYSQILLTCVRLGLVSLLNDRSRRFDEIATALDLSDDAVRRLLRAATALRLVKPFGKDKYGLGSLGAALAGNPAVTAMIEHHALLYSDLGDPVGLLRGARAGTEGLAGYWPYAGADEEGASEALADDQIAPYTELMAASQSLIVDDILASYDFAQHRVILDVGGGRGVFLEHVAMSAPKARLVLFDLPPVADQARLHLHDKGLEDRVQVNGGDFLRDPLPAGPDLVTLVRIVHDHNDQAVVTLLRAIHRVLPEDGALLIAEPMSGGPGANRIADAYFGFYLLAMGSGRARTVDEHEALLRQAGFRRVRPLRTRMPQLVRVLVAQP